MTWKPVSKAKYYEMLYVLPPAAHVAAGFLVGEAWDHTPEGEPRYEAFFQKGSSYFVADQPLTVSQFREAAR